MTSQGDKTLEHNGIAGKLRGVIVTKPPNDSASACPLQSPLPPYGIPSPEKPSCESFIVNLPDGFSGCRYWAALIDAMNAVK